MYLDIVIFHISQNTSSKTKLIKRVVFSAMSKKHFPPFFNDNPQVPSGRGDLGGGGKGWGFHEKVTQVLLRRKVMLCHDTNRFLDSCKFFEIFKEQNSNFMAKKRQRQATRSQTVVCR